MSKIKKKKQVNKENLQLERSIKEIKRIVKKIKLDLSERTILTEAASGAYALTPIIALEAKAKKIICLGQDSNYGKLIDIKKNIETIAEKYYPDLKNRLIIKSNTKINYFSQGEIITNTGFLRPLNKKKIELLPNNAVISLMYEGWEFRKDEIDLLIANKLNIPVIGVNEHFEDYNIFKYVGALLAKMIFESGFEIYNNSILFIGNDDFTFVSAQYLREMDAKTTIISSQDIKAILNNPSKKENFFSNNSYDFVVIVDYLLSDINKRIIENDLNNYSLFVLPFVWNTRMKHTFSYLGSIPVIKLMTLGLKVGQELFSAKQQFYDAKKASEYVIDSDLGSAINHDCLKTKGSFL